MEKGREENVRIALQLGQGPGAGRAHCLQELRPQHAHRQCPGQPDGAPRPALLQVAQQRAEQDNGEDLPAGAQRVPQERPTLGQAASGKLAQAAGKIRRIQRDTIQQRLGLGIQAAGQVRFREPIRLRRQGTARQGQAAEQCKKPSAHPQPPIQDRSSASSAVKSGRDSTMTSALPQSSTALARADCPASRQRAAHSSVKSAMPVHLSTGRRYASATPAVCASSLQKLRTGCSSSAAK